MEVGTKDCVIVKGLTLDLFRKMYILVLWIWKAMECFKWGLGQAIRNMEDGGTEGHLNCLCLLAQKVSVENNFHI